jgi:hypothetical protein
MASDLKWRMGFGWGPVILALGACLVAWMVPGIPRWLGIGIATGASAYMFHQYRRWNRPGWRLVHFRAMLAYSGIAAREQSAARQSGRVFDLAGACTQLALLLCGEDKKAVVDAMIVELTRQQGAFLAGLVERHSGVVLQGAPFDLRRDITSGLRSVRLGPQLVIASVIENTYGGAEAARYAVALVTGDAK